MLELSPGKLAVMTSDIVSAYVATHSIAASELPSLIVMVHQAIVRALAGPAAGQAPAVPVERSITPNAILCLEDGLAFKSLKRHLQIAHGLTPAEYRLKWSLPADYPLVAPRIVNARSLPAKGGQAVSKPASIPTAHNPAQPPAHSTKRRGRPRNS